MCAQEAAEADARAIDEAVRYLGIARERMTDWASHPAAENDGIDSVNDRRQVAAAWLAQWPAILAGAEAVAVRFFEAAAQAEDYASDSYEDSEEDEAGAEAPAVRPSLSSAPVSAVL